MSMSGQRLSEGYRETERERERDMEEQTSTTLCPNSNPRLPPPAAQPLVLSAEPAAARPEGVVDELHRRTEPVARPAVGRQQHRRRDQHDARERADDDARDLAALVGVFGKGGGSVAVLGLLCCFAAGAGG